MLHLVVNSPHAKRKEKSISFRSFYEKPFDPDVQVTHKRSQPSSISFLRKSRKALEESHVWSGSLEGGSELLFGWSLNLLWKWEGKVFLVELNEVWSLALFVSQDGSLNNLNGSRTQSVASGQVLIQLVDSSVHGDISELLKHVVVSCSRQHSDPDAEVLHGGRVLLEDLVDGNDLSVCLLHSFQTLEEVPELGSSDDLIRSPDLHSIESWARITLSGQVTSHNMVLMILW